MSHPCHIQKVVDQHFVSVFIDETPLLGTQCNNQWVCHVWHVILASLLLHRPPGSAKSQHFLYTLKLSLMRGDWNVSGGRTDTQNDDILLPVPQNVSNECRLNVCVTFSCSVSVWEQERKQLNPHESEQAGASFVITEQTQLDSLLIANFFTFPRSFCFSKRLIILPVVKGATLCYCISEQRKCILLL